jgi:branched-chain amino acid transport system permease protein
MRFERLFLLAAFAVAGILPLITRNEYLVHIGVIILFSMTMAASFNLIVGYIGEFPLGHTAFLGVGAYTAAILSTRLGLPIYATVPIGGVFSAIAGLFIGSITLRLRGPFFVIVTLCFAEVLRLVASNWVDLTNGPMGVSGIPKPGWIATQSTLGQKMCFYYIAWLIAAITLYVCFRFVYSNLGRAAVAVRENRFVAQSVGIKPYHYALLTFVLAALLCGFAGSFYAHYISYVGPEVFGFPFMISMIIMVLLGGKGTLAGVIVGPIVIVLLQEYLRDLQTLRLSIFGLIVMAVVLFLPNGLMGFVGRRREIYART